MISVLLPSRGRPDKLSATARGLVEKASDPSSVEILVAADADDELTARAHLPAQARVWTSPQRHGYHQLHVYVNKLASMASGDWLFLWNDDAMMLTLAWDEVVHRQRPAVLWPQSNDQAHCNVFPIWPKKWTDATGHVSLSPHNDTWIQDIGALLGRQHGVDVSVFHGRPDLTGEPGDQTHLEGAAVGYRTSEFYSPEMMAARRADAEIIRKLL